MRRKATLKTTTKMKTTTRARLRREQWQNVIWKYEIMSISHTLHVVSCVFHLHGQKTKNDIKNDRKRERKRASERERMSTNGKWSTTSIYTALLSSTMNTLLLPLAVLKNKCAAYSEQHSTLNASYSCWIYMCIFFRFFHVIFLVWCLLRGRIWMYICLCVDVKLNTLDTLSLVYLYF